MARMGARSMRKLGENASSQEAEAQGWQDSVWVYPDSVVAAAEWIAAQPPGVTVPTIKAKFSLSAKEACEAIALAVNMRRSGPARASEFSDTEGGSNV